MSDHTILTSRDKEILSEEAGPDDFADFENRKSKIRYRVRKRGKVLVAELELLSNFGETQVVDEFCQTISDGVPQLVDSDIEQRLEMVERELDNLEESKEDIERLRSEILEIRAELDL